MKKILLILLVTLVAVILVACGGETTTTPTTTDKPAVTTTVPGTTKPTVTTTTKAPEGVTTTAPTTDPAVTTAAPTAGIDIMNGAVEYGAIDPFWNNSTWPCAFEEHHPELNYHWCLVFKMLPTDEFVQEQLIAMDEELGVGTAYDDYTWTLIIDGTKHVIKEFSIPQRTGFIYVRMGLGEDFRPVDGEHEYEIRLEITEAGTDKLVFFANFTDPDMGGLYKFEAPKPIEMVVADKPADVEMIPMGSLQGISGPAGVAAAETYVSMFDGMVRTKLCAADTTSPIIFMVNDNVTSFDIKGISIVGANDDEKFPERVFATFKVYGANSGDPNASWELLKSVDQSADFGTVTNYGERYYALDKTSDYRYYKIEIETTAARYQCSEILLYAEKGSVFFQ